MHLTYEKLGKDHPLYGKVDYLVMDETTPICYKTKDGYQPLEVSSAAQPQQVEVETRPLFILSFKINDELEEQVFKSKKKLDKTIALYETKPYVTDIKTQVVQTLV